MFHIQSKHFDTYSWFTCPELVFFYISFLSGASFFLLIYAEIKAFNLLKALFSALVSLKRTAKINNTFLGHVNPPLMVYCFLLQAINLINFV